MDFDVTSLAPIDPGKYLAMWFVSGGLIMVCFYFGTLAERKEWLPLIVFVSAALGLWHYGVAEGWRIPGF